MTATKRRLSFQPAATPTLEEQLSEVLVKKNTKVVELEADENGNVIIDKDKHPDIYDWAMNG
ncbi:MAG: hypothetical protein FWB96_00415 [Defluviitaleaceae bacterium]|nr:hypothetical protein [Defluviitaleaceae bacterium]MCL2261825.1 hypothetical protein [Defluviitaleaceae bacterium]